MPFFAWLMFRLTSHWKQFRISGSSRIGNDQLPAALDEFLHLGQAQPFQILHVNRHSPAGCPFSPGSCSGSPRIGNNFAFQAHPALETTSLSRLIPHWTILPIFAKLFEQPWAKHDSRDPHCPCLGGCESACGHCRHHSHPHCPCLGGCESACGHCRHHSLSTAPVLRVVARSRTASAARRGAAGCRRTRSTAGPPPGSGRRATESVVWDRVSPQRSNSASGS